MLLHAATRTVMVNAQQGRLQALNMQSPALLTLLCFPKNFLGVSCVAFTEEKFGLL